MTQEKKFLLDEIVEIKHLGKKQCYDLTIPKNHNFFANGILVHNTGVLEEHADTVMLLHWEDFYKEDFNKGGVFKVNIAKQRNGRTGVYYLTYYPQYYRFEEQ